MQYLKPALTYDAQADLLRERGLEGERSELISLLRTVSYYRLSGYLYPFRVAGGDVFRPGTQLSLVQMHYEFDRALRLLLLDAIERFEVHLKSTLTYRFVHRFGPFGYTRPDVFAPSAVGEHAILHGKIKDEVKRSREVFLTHFREKYGDSHEQPPLWMTIEVLSLGTTLSFFRIADADLKKTLAGEFGVHERVFESWVTALNALRNICAHHGRVWNREFGYKPLIPNKQPLWQGVRNDRLFGMLCILRHLLRTIAPQGDWHGRVEALLDAHPQIPRLSMGMSPAWNEHPLWKSTP